MRGPTRLLALTSCLGCSAIILGDESGSGPSAESSEASSEATGTDSGPVPHPLDGSSEIDCANAQVSSNCAWTLESTAQSCELRCELAAPCEVLAVDYDYETQGYVDPIDEGRLGCLLDALGANSQAYLEWTEHGTGNQTLSDTTYRAWLLRPQELVLARWHESTIEGNIGPYGQSLAAVRYDSTQLLDCQAETQGAARYRCMLEALTEAGCYGFGPASCE